MNRLSLICGVILVLSLAATHQVEGQDSSPEPAAGSKHTENALKILSGMTQFIETAPAFSASGNFGGDLILDNGQMVEHGSSFSFVFSRPARFYMRLNSRDGYETTMFFDGETITVASSNEGRHIYDTTPQPGDVDDSLEFLVGQTGGPRELEYFLNENWTETLNRVQSGYYVGKSTIGGVLCDHLAARTDSKDGQVWIEPGDEPTPWRILSTHRKKPGQPRFWVQFDKWDFTPELSDATFIYTPPEGAVKFSYFSE